MKPKITFLIGILFMFLSCNNSEKQIEDSDIAKDDTEVTPSLEGAWELVGFYNYANNVVVDSFSNNTIARQVKMYTDDKVMWCKLLKTDSIEFFGYGSYRHDESSLTEILEFGSAFMNEVIAEQQEFNFELSISPNRFEQIELDDDGNRIYSENYVRIE
ncbi:hypothetical protein [Winogradskyella ursingii]|uniref:hypothetical protein n=1 Tax=Winogradskyella ursingii TaxID=2686079 RepID=UPI0015CB31B4|nr:hypothetical protein [Winogradskyella ursingii]